MNYYGNEAMAAGTAKETVRVTQVQTAVEQLAKATAALEHVSSMLESRLSGVLQSVPPQPQGTGQKVRAVTVALADIITTNCENLETVAHRLDSMLSRLEL